MANPYNKILFSHKQEWSIDIGYNVAEPGKHHAEGSTKGHTLNASSYKKYPEWANLQRQKGFPEGSAVKNLPAVQETWVQSWVGKIPWKRKWQPTPVFLPRKSHGQRSLVGYSLWGWKVWCDWARTHSNRSEYLSISPASERFCNSWLATNPTAVNWDSCLSLLYAEIHRCSFNTWSPVLSIMKA